MWFERLVGFEEDGMENVRSKLIVEGNRLHSTVNGRSFIFGELELASLAALRQKAPIEVYRDKITVEEVVGNVQKMHQAAENNGAIFQAASQFNLLEMVGPHVTPESGVGIYENDYTQGPACAIACGAGTIYRNYFVPVNGHIGQSFDNQIDCLDGIGEALNNPTLKLWKMSNGYAFPTADGLRTITELIQSKTEWEKDELKSKLKVGIQWSTQVTLNGSENLVSQVYCSALPVAYSGIAPREWEVFARLILEATYEATLYAALINYTNTGNKKCYLTLVGGGAFGNSRHWIMDAMRKALTTFQRTPLDVKIVSYGGSDDSVQELIASINLTN